MKNCKNAIAAWSNGKVLAPLLIVGIVNANVFYAWIKQCLIPELPKRSVIVMDNATFHKRKDIIEKIEKKGIILKFLPPYCPDFNPIEKKGAQAKALRKNLRYDDIDLLFEEHFGYVNL